jgi:predicted dithiol-disulfide oxidoreductase (DUF899 family)
MKNVVTHAAWIESRKALLAKEKAFTRERDALSAARRALPMEKIEKRYLFDEPSGQRSLGDLFEGRPQLIVYHFMYDPSWDAGCKSCSYVADNFAGGIVHLAAHNTSFAVISSAPSAKLEAYRKRMGWSFRWLSSANTDFNRDFRVTFSPEEVASGSVDYNYQQQAFKGPEAPGVSVFLREGDDVFHTYSAYSRGLDILIGTNNYLDLTPLGRQEEKPMQHVRRHDEYQTLR